MSFKYELDTKVIAREELIICSEDDQTGEEYEIVIPEGAAGTIESCGWSSTEGFEERYDVLFMVNGSEETVSFFLEDLEQVLIIEEDTP